MALPPVKNVTRQHRTKAYLIVGSMAFVVLAYFTSRVHLIFSGIDMPPLDYQISNGKLVENGVSAWGSMPNLLVVKAGGWSTDILSVAVQNGWLTYDTMAQIPGAKAPAVSLNSSIWEGSDVFIITLEGLAPNFHSVWGAYVDVDVHFGVPGEFDWPGLELYMIPDAWTGHWQDLQRQTQMTFPSGSGLVYQNFVVTKSFVPEAGRFFGLPSEGAHTARKFEVVPSNIQAWNGRPELRCVSLRFWVVNSAVVHMLPVSVISQLGRLVSGLGGLMTIIGAIFSIMFVRKYPLSVTEEESSSLTFLGCAEQRRVEDADYVRIDK